MTVLDIIYGVIMSVVLNMILVKTHLLKSSKTELVFTNFSNIILEILIPISILLDPIFRCCISSIKVFNVYKVTRFLLSSFIFVFGLIFVIKFKFF